MTKKQALRVLVKGGWDKDRAKLAVDSITGMRAALDTFMPHIGESFTHDGWTVSRVQPSDMEHQP